MTSAVTSKPPLPVTQTVRGDMIEELALARTRSPSGVGNELHTSQKETVSDGTILGLKDMLYVNEPDLTYYCAQCSRFVPLLSLRDHKSYHNAMSLLDLSQLPVSLRALISRRHEVIRRLKETAADQGAVLDIKAVQQIDDAYEILKQELQDTFESCRRIDEDIAFKVDSYDLACGVPCVAAVGHCSDNNTRWKSKMEDCKVYQDYFGNDANKAFVALFDGYDGRYASAVAANELHYLLLRELAKFDPSVSCRCTFNMLEENDISQFDLIRPPAIPCGHTRQVHKGSSNIVQQTVYTCERADTEGTNHLSSHHPIRNKPSEESLLPVSMTHKVMDEYSQHVKAAFKMAYKLTDRVLAYGGDEKSRVRWSGCSAVTVIVEHVENDITPILPSASSGPTELEVESKVGGAETTDITKGYEEPKTVGRLHIANTGNCHAVLVRDNRSYLLTKSHTYENVRERNRIINSGGTFSQSEKEMRVNGISLTTRGLGNHGDPTLKALISIEPHCTTVPIDQYAQLLILATAGVWQVFSPQEAAELLLQILPQNRMPTPGYVSPSVDLLQPNLPNAEQIHEGNDSVKQLPNSSPIAEDEFAEETIHLPLEDVVVTERKSSLSAQPAASARKSRGHATSVTFQSDIVGGELLTTRDKAVEAHEGITYSGGRLNEEVTVSGGGLNEEVTVSGGGLNEEEEELREIRSEDSGNEADVDTDWASTVPPNDLSLRSALSGQGNLHRYLSKLLSERLVQSALLAGAKDNISAVVFILPGTKIVDI